MHGLHHFPVVLIFLHRLVSMANALLGMRNINLLLLILLLHMYTRSAIPTGAFDVGVDK
jgi:hypothetical protein